MSNDSAALDALRAMPLRKAPSVSESVDWARTLLTLGASSLDTDVVRRTLNVLLKHTDDIERAIAGLDLDKVLATP